MGGGRHEYRVKLMGAKQFVIQVCSGLTSFVELKQLTYIGGRKGRETNRAERRDLGLVCQAKKLEVVLHRELSVLKAGF